MSSDQTARLARLAFVVLAWTFVACLVVQLLLVGLDVFEVTGGAVSVHRDFAYLYGWITPGLVLLASVGRWDRSFLWKTVALLVLFAVQTYLPLTAEELPWLAALHAINALLIFWLAIQVATSASRGIRPEPAA